MKNLTVIVGLALLALAIAGHRAEAQMNTTPALRHVAVTGTGEVEVEPDSARIDLAVEFRAKDLNKIKTDIDAITSKLLGIFKQADIKERDINTAQLLIWPEYDTAKSNELLGYRVSRGVTVRLRDLTKLGALLDALIQAGANKINSIALESSREDELKRQAQALALKNARETAAFLAEQLGAKLGRVHSITDTPQPVPKMFRNAMAMQAEAGDTFKPGVIDVTSTISVIFELD